jgi:predicted Zn finger-like uncharacterized protein
MLLSCPECHAQYNMTPAQLGDEGRNVRCTTCRHVWFQKPEQAQQPSTQRPAMPPEQSHPTTSVKTFEALLQSAKTADTAHRSEPIPDAVNPIMRQHEIMPTVVTNNPLGVGSAQFGILVFLLLNFLTAMGLLIALKPITTHFPQTALLYKAVGFKITSPEDDLRLSAFTAERRANTPHAILAIDGKMTNITEHDAAYPSLYIALKDKDNILKEWTLKSMPANITAGETKPVKIQLKDAPDGGKTLEIHIAKN